MAAGARSRGTVALELAPGQRGPLDNSEADRRRPTRAVQVDSDSTSKSYPNDFRHDRPTRTPIDSGLNRRCDPHKAPLSPQSDGEAAPRPATIGGGPGRYCRQLDSDTGDALAHLALDRHAAHSPGRATEAGRRLNAGDPGAVRAVLCGSKPSDCRGVDALTPRAHFPLFWSQVGLGLISTAPGGIAPRSPCERDPCLAPLSPSMGLGKPRTGCSSHDTPLGAASRHLTGQRSTCRLRYRPGPRPTADVRIG